MSGDTIERPPQPKEGKTGPIKYHNPCGDVLLWPAPLELHKGTSIHQGPNGTKENWIRYAVDNLVAFIPPKGSKCKQYGYMQFVNRTATDTKTKQPVTRYSHPWQPDIKDWDKRAKKTFLDPMELLYDPNLVEVDKAHNAVVRRDGPGYDHPPGKPPKDLSLHWDYKVYIICQDAEGALKVVGLLEFSFDIDIDAQGVPTLRAPEKGKPGYPNLTSICCNQNDTFDTWIDQWHAHNVLPGQSMKSLRELFSVMPQLVDESVRSRRALHFIENTGRGVARPSTSRPGRCR